MTKTETINGLEIEYDAIFYFVDDSGNEVQADWVLDGIPQYTGLVEDGFADSEDAEAWIAKTIEELEGDGIARELIKW